MPRIIESRRAFPKHAGPVRDVVFRAEDKRLITCSDGTYQHGIWDPTTGRDSDAPLAHYGKIVRQVSARDGKLAARTTPTPEGCGIENGELRMITGTPLMHRQRGGSRISHSVPTGDGLVTESECRPGTAQIWPLRSIDTSADEMEQLAQLMCATSSGWTPPVWRGD